jgi:tetratricopeptide (TPR) repeat protein
MRKRLLHILMLYLCTCGVAWAGEAAGPEARYFENKASGNYSSALEILVRWTGHERDPLTVELNLFRIEELIETGLPLEGILSALDTIEKSNVVITENGFLKARLGVIRGRVLLGMGRAEKASELSIEAGFIGHFRITGPFANAHARDFDVQRAPDRGYAQGERYRGKLHSVEWFDARAGRTGCYDLGEMGLDTSEALYYFSTDISIPEDGEYVMLVGKTGFMDASVDGVQVFSSRKRHSFHHDQYRITMRLSPGKHAVSIKAGDSLDGIRLSVRIADASGKGINILQKEGVRLNDNPVQAGSVSVFSGMVSSLEAAPQDARMAFITGYLYLRSGLDSENDREAVYWLERSSTSDALRGMAGYYAGLCEGETGRREDRFWLVLVCSPRHYEALAGLARIKVDNGFYFDAIPLLERMRTINGSAVAAHACYAAVYTARGWYEESLKTAAHLKSAGHEADGHQLAGDIWLKKGIYSQSALEYTAALNCDQSGKIQIHDAFSSLKKCGEYLQARSLLERSIRLYPSDALLRFELAGLIRNTQGGRVSIPYYAAVLQINPYHAGALEGIGRAYCSLNRMDVAMEYFSRALASAPGNFSLREYVESLRGTAEARGEYTFREEMQDLIERAQRYTDEPVITLIDECIIEVNADGSTVKNVRRVYLINDASAASRYSRQHVLLSPDTDSLEEFKCIVDNEGERFEISDRSAMSLSDPESSMYYDQRAELMSVPALKKGSVLEVLYRIRHDAREVYRGYFGESMFLGSENRVLAFNFVVTYPVEKDIYCFMKKGARLPLVESSDGKKKSYRILARDVAPVAREIGMPHLSDLVPSMYFSTLKDWGEIHRWYVSLVKNRAQASEEMKKNLAGLVGRNDGVMERVNKIYRHVSGMVRYVGFELGIGGLQPRNAGDTYATRMGDCKDITFVLITMLREAGIDARMALLRTRDRGRFDRETPFLGQFNHAVCYVAVNGGIFLDATAKMSGIRELPADDRDLEALVLDENGYEFITTAQPFYDGSRDIVVNEVTIDADGNAAIIRKMYKAGSLAGGARLELLDADGKLNTIAEYWNARYPGSSIKNLSVKSLDPDTPVSYSYEVGIKNLARQLGSVSVLRSHLMTSEYYAKYAFRPQRRLPIVLQDKWFISVTTRYRLPAGFTVSVLPDSEEFTDGKFRARFGYEKKDDSLIEIVEQIGFNDDTIAPQDYEVFRNFTLFIQRKENESIILRKKQ